MDDYPATNNKTLIDILYKSGKISGGIIYDKYGEGIAIVEGEFNEYTPYTAIKDTANKGKTYGYISYGSICDQHDNLVASIGNGMVTDQMGRRPRTIFIIDNDGYVDDGTVRVKRGDIKRELNSLQIEYETQAAIEQNEKKKIIPKEKSLLKKVMDRLYQRSHNTNNKIN